jgi:hypothetical protein
MVVTIDTDFNITGDWPNLSHVTVFFKSLFSILYDIRVWNFKSIYQIIAVKIDLKYTE